MSDLIHRAQKAKALAKDLSLPKWRRLNQGLQALSGLELSAMPDGAREEFEADLIVVNHVLADYQLDEHEDYQCIRDSDLDTMLDALDAATSGMIAAELDRIVADLDSAGRRLPVKSIEEAREHRDLMVPKLIEVLRDVTSAARAGEIRKGQAHFFAIFLLTEFRAEEAFPVILEAFSLPGDLPRDLFGDAVTSTFARILALFAADRPELVDALIGDSRLNKFVRWEAAQCYVNLVRDQRLTRDEAVERLRQQLRQAMAEKDEDIAGAIICVLVSFAPVEALADIKEAYRLDLIDIGLVGLEDVESSVAQGEERIRKEKQWCSPTGIEDVVEELKHWASFAEKPTQRRVRPPSPPRPHVKMSQRANDLEAVPVPTGSSRVGRNDPCPCGSGKKFKKCCGSRK